VTAVHRAHSGRWPSQKSIALCSDGRHSLSHDQLCDMTLQTIICMHCGSGQATLRPAVCDSVDYSCANCGDYSVSSMMQTIIKNGHADPRLAEIIADNGKRYLRPSSR
jgi:hypothetical protein